MNKGFTLLEVLIAMSLLALGLTALIGHQSVAVQMSHSSNQIGQANLLAQGKLLDLEHLLISESMDMLDNCEDGNFRREDFDEFEWRAWSWQVSRWPESLPLLEPGIRPVPTSPELPLPIVAAQNGFWDFDFGLCVAICPKLGIDPAGFFELLELLFYMISKLTGREDEIVMIFR